MLGAGLAGALWRAPQTFERGAVVRTLLQDLPPESLAGGPTLFHEHLSNLWPIGAASSFTDDVDLMIEETRIAA